MKTLLTFLSMASLTAFAAVETLAAGNAVVINPTGEMRIQLEVPLAENVDITPDITEGRLELAPAEGVPVVGGRFFMLTLASLRFADFRIDRWVINAQNFRQATVELREAVAFTALEVSPGVYNFSIPTTQITFAGAAVVNGDRRWGVDRPNQPVTGTIDLNTGTIQARAVVPKHYDCGWSCSVDGTVTVTFSGVLGPDSDRDGVRDTVDNCPRVFNPQQRRIVSPVITPPVDLSLSSCQRGVLAKPHAVDICEPNLGVSMSDNAPAQWPVGDTVVDWTARSVSGRTSVAQQHVAVVDRTAPSFKSVPAAIDRDTCGPVELGGPIAYDDCDFGPPALTNDAPKSFGPGATKVAWTAWDRSGNRSVVTQTVTVKDEKPPVFTFVPPATTIAACARADIGRAEAEDGCGVRITNDAPEKFELGKPTLVTWTARDGAGNVAIATQPVTCDGKGGRDANGPRRH